MGTLEAIKVKILIMGEEVNPLTLRIELTSENDLFFHFNHNLDEHGFRQVTRDVSVCVQQSFVACPWSTRQVVNLAFMQVQEHQKLMVDFPEYPNVLIRMLNNCIKVWRCREVAMGRVCVLVCLHCSRLFSSLTAQCDCSRAAVCVYVYVCVCV